MSEFCLYAVAPSKGYPIEAIFRSFEKALNYRHNFCPSSYRAFRIDISSNIGMYYDFEKYTTAAGVICY